MLPLCVCRREWRISHVLSHHIYTNTVQDLEMALLYPFLHWYPTEDKPFTVRMFPYLTPVTYPFILLGQLVIRYTKQYINRTSRLYDLSYIFISLLRFRTFKRNNDIADLMMFVIPAILMLCGQMTVLSISIAWLIIVLTSSFVFTFIGFSASHHFPENFHDGDCVK